MRTAILGSLFFMALASCGQKGPLVLPDATSRKAALTDAKPAQWQSMTGHTQIPSHDSK